jgi:NAD+ kinase
MSARRFGLIANANKVGARELVSELCEEFARHGVKMVLESRTAALLGAQSTASAAELCDQCELIVVVGGDGTLLQVVHELDHQLPPIFGINLGSLGFLTSVSSGAWRQAVECLVGESFSLSHRTLLSVEVLREETPILVETALNDAVISRGELSHLIKVDVRIDGISLSEYNADGLIVATPTGSTAYSLSAGGPVLTPNCGIFVITPICPHVLTLRPIIVSDCSTIEIAQSRHQSDIFLTLDGQNSIHLQTGDRIRITKAPHRLSLALLPGMTFFEVLRQKLKWSGTAV